MNEASDSELMILAQEGSSGAFDLLFERYRNRIFSFLCRMLGSNTQAAEELLQEVFVKAFQGRDLFEPKAKFSTWLYTIARNHFRNHVKSRRYDQAMRTVSLDAEAAGAEIADRTPRVTAMEREEQVEAMEGAIAQLEEKYREVFLLHAVDGLAHEEIARMLDVNPATVRTTYHRARRMLRERLEPVLSEEAGVS